MMNRASKRAAECARRQADYKVAKAREDGARSVLRVIQAHIRVALDYPGMYSSVELELLFKIRDDAQKTTRRAGQHVTVALMAWGQAVDAA